MFDFAQMFTFGREVEAHGKKYVLLHHLQKSYYLAVQSDAVFPCQAELIKYDEPKAPDVNTDEIVFGEGQEGKTNESQ
jgi:hypothetical protein